jgi:predicted permease
MRKLREWIVRLGSLSNKQRRNRELDDELESHLRMHIEDNLRLGMPSEEARRLAMIKLGGIESTKEAYRDQRGLPVLETFWQDVRYGTRQLRKNPVFTAVAVLTLALGIGANTAIFSVINSVLLRPLPYRDPDRLVTVCQSNLKRGFSQVVVTPAFLRGWHDQNTVFEELGGQIYQSVNLTGVERPEHLHAAWTTPNYFSVFGVAPLLGRTFVADDKPPGGQRVAVLSYGLWQRSFGGDRAVIGRSITLNGLSYSVVGVMPSGFKIYQPAAVFGLPTGDVQPQLWAPYPGSMEERTNHYFLAFARLKTGVTASDAQNELNTIAGRLSQERPSEKDWRASVQPLDEQVVGGSRLALRFLLGSVGFVLLIACANVANLTLVRSATRRKEFAVRSALGASRLRIVRQLLVESTILAVLGGGLGVLFARWGVAGLTALPSASLERFDEIRLDGPVLVFTLVISILTGFIFGFAPAVQASKPNLDDSLREGSRSSGEGRGGGHVRSLLVISEVALTMMLLVGAGLMINSFVRLTRINPGFAPEQLMTFDFSIAGRAYDEDAKRIGLIRQLRERIQAKPGVIAIATVYGLPFGTMLNAVVGAVIGGQSDSDPQRNIRAAWRVVSPNYFKTMGVPLLTGRTFSEALDTMNAPPAAIINQSFARKYLPGENPVGRKIQIFTLSTNWHEIVGVFKDVKLTGLDAPTTPEIYQSDSQNGEWMFSLVVRSTQPAREIERLVRAEAMNVNKDLPPFNVRTMEQAIGTSVAPRQFTMTLIGLFAGLAVILTAVGIYGVVSYSVSRRTHEIGIRVALGASRGSVFGLIFRQVIIVASVGIILGLTGSLALRRLIATQLFGVSAADPITYSLVSILLTLVALLACYVPARRATKVDPMVALRCE